MSGGQSLKELVGWTAEQRGFARSHPPSHHMVAWGGVKRTGQSKITDRRCQNEGEKCGRLRERLVRLLSEHKHVSHELISRGHGWMCGFSEVSLPLALSIIHCHVYCMERGS